MEPFGRIGIGIGVAEMIAAILILIPRFVWLGVGLTLGIIGGAVIMHLTILGIDVKGDGGALFYTALLTFARSAIILWLHQSDLIAIFKKN